MIQEGAQEAKEVWGSAQMEEIYDQQLAPFSAIFFTDFLGMLGEKVANHCHITVGILQVVVSASQLPSLRLQSPDCEILVQSEQ